MTEEQFSEDDDEPETEEVDGEESDDEDDEPEDDDTDDDEPEDDDMESGETDDGDELEDDDPDQLENDMFTEPEDGYGDRSPLSSPFRDGSNKDIGYLVGIQRGHEIVFGLENHLKMAHAKLKEHGLTCYDGEKMDD